MVHSVKARAFPFLLLLLFVTFAHTAWGQACPSRCRGCTNNVAECAKRSLVAPPKSYPPDILSINLQDNYIRVLGSRTFRAHNAVEMLKISGNRISSIRGDAFRSFPNLMSLDLANNRIVKIYARGFNRLSKLRTLSLNRNRIRSISRIFVRTPNLYQLNLANNRITSIREDDLSPLNRMHYLDIRDNHLTSIDAKAFSQLRLLRYLFLNSNPIVRLPSLLFSSTVLQLVDFSNCQLTSVPGKFPSSVTDLRLGQNKIMQVNHTDFTNMTMLKLLALNDNELHFLADGALTNMPHLQEVWLRGNNLVYVPRDLPNNLRRLYIDSNNIRVIEPGLFGPDSQLDYMTVENNKIQRIDNGTFTGLRYLTSLNFQGNQIHTIESGTFSNLGNLSSLALSNNPLEAIQDGAFHNLNNLTQLMLSYLPSEIFQMQGLNFLASSPQLQQLQMVASPGLAEAITHTLATTEGALTNLDQLTQLDLSYNNLHTISITILDHVPQLAYLALDFNPLVCDQRTAWLKQQLQHSYLTFYSYEDLMCHNPPDLAGTLVRDVADFPPVAQDTNSWSSSSHAAIQALHDGQRLSAGPTRRHRSHITQAHLEEDRKESQRRRKNRDRKRKKDRKGKKDRSSKKEKRGKKKDRRGKGRRQRRGRKQRMVTDTGNAVSG